MLSQMVTNTTSAVGRKEHEKNSSVVDSREANTADDVMEDRKDPCRTKLYLSLPYLVSRLLAPPVALPNSAEYGFSST